MDLGKQFRTDKLKETKGTWIEIQDSELLIARNNTRAYRVALAKALSDNPSAMEASNEKEEAASDAILAAVVAETVLLGWKNVTVDGKPVKYTPKKAEKLLAELPDFMDLVRGLSDNIENFRVDQEEKEVKNS